MTYDIITPSHLATARAVDQLRRQLGIVLQENNGNYFGTCPIEGMTPSLWQQLQSLPDKKLFLLITGARAQYLHLEARNTRIDANHLTLSELLALSDPLAQGSLPEITPMPTTVAQDMALTMAKYATLLPAMVIVESKKLPDNWLTLSVSDATAYWSDPPLEMITLSSASLPIEGAENTVLTCFRGRFGTSTHLAMVVGDITSNAAPLTRIHSSCITGDILGSLRCDCGDQLHMALSQIREAGGGILLYLHQEGRGIGIANKLRAYQLQEKGMDTYDANLALGFDEDERDFSIAAKILKILGVNSIQLLTNNPKKIAALEDNGVIIQGRIPLISRPGQHNHAYLAAKSKKAGHLF